MEAQGVPMSELLTTSDRSKLLVGLPYGDWVAISCDEHCVLANDADMQDVLSRAREQGENHPIVVKVPGSDVSLGRFQPTASQDPSTGLTN